jgi:hypothetical protein
MKIKSKLFQFLLDHRDFYRHEIPARGKPIGGVALRPHNSQPYAFVRAFARAKSTTQILKEGASLRWHSVFRDFTIKGRRYVFERRLLLARSSRSPPLECLHHDESKPRKGPTGCVPFCVGSHSVWLPHKRIPESASLPIRDNIRTLQCLALYPAFESSHRHQHKYANELHKEERHKSFTRANSKVCQRSTIGGMACPLSETEACRERCELLRLSAPGALVAKPRARKLIQKATGIAFDF